MTDLLTPAQVAQRLSVSRSMVYAMTSAGELPVVRIGRLPRYRPADVEAYIEQQGG